VCTYKNVYIYYIFTIGRIVSGRLLPAVAVVLVTPTAHCNGGVTSSVIQVFPPQSILLSSSTQKNITKLKELLKIPKIYRTHIIFKHMTLFHIFLKVLRVSIVKKMYLLSKLLKIYE